MALCAQYFTVTPSTLCVYVFFQVHSSVLGGITAPALLPYLFQNKHDQNLKAREKSRQKNTLGRKYMYIFFSSEWKIKLPRGLKYSKGKEIRAQ